MDWLKDAIRKAADIKDWKIAIIYCAMLSFLGYCVFFGGVKQITDLFEEKVEHKSATVDSLKVQ